MVHFVFWRKAPTFVENFRVDSPDVKYGENEIETEYKYDTTELVYENRNGSNSKQWYVKPKSVVYNFKTSTRVPKLGWVHHFQI